MAAIQGQLGLKMNFLGTDIIGACERRETTDGRKRDAILVKNLIDEKKDTGISVKEIADSIIKTIGGITSTTDTPQLAQ